MGTVLQCISGLLIMAAVWGVETPCYVTSVRGDVRASGKTLKVGDTLSEQRFHLISSPEGGCVTLFHPVKGSIRVLAKKIARESTVEYVAHLLKMKSKTVSLSSRSSQCDCVDYRECFETDQEINPHLLISDSLEFPVESLTQQSGPSVYFLQWKEQGVLKNRQLKVRQDKVLIQRSDIRFAPDSEGIPVSEPLSLVAARQIDGKTSYTVLAKITFAQADFGELVSYWRVLRRARPDLDPVSLQDTLYRDLYLLYGKPDKCTIERISKQTL